MGCLLTLIWWSSTLSAQSADEAAAPEEQPTIEVTTELDALLAEIALQNTEFRQLEERIQENEGLAAKILGERLDRMLTSIFQNTVLLAQRVAAEQERGTDVSAYRDQLIERLSALPDEARAAMQRVR
ncbi:MAG: hypothetical protein V3T18_11400, partial [Pseudomonadales bacterium]